MIEKGVPSPNNRDLVVPVRVFPPDRLAAAMALIGSVLIGYVIAAPGPWAKLAFLTLGSALAFLIPAHWLAIGAISLYQGYPLDILDIPLLSGSELNFRLSDLILLLLLVRTAAKWSLRSQKSEKERADFRILGLLAVFLLWSFMTSLVFAGRSSTGLLEYMTSLGKMTLPLSLTVYLALGMTRPHEFELILRWVVGWGLIQTAAGFVRWLPLAVMNVDWIPLEAPVRDWLAIPSHPLVGGLPTLTGFFGDPAKLGYWLIVALWAKVYFVRRKNKPATVWDRLQLTILVLGAVATTRRGPLSAMVASAAIYLIATKGYMAYTSHKIFRRGALILVIGAVTLLAGFIFSPFRPTSDMFRITNDINYGFTGRLRQSIVLWQNFLEAPLSGVGWMGNSLAGKTFWAAPNYMVILADLGLPGLILLLGLIVVSLYKSWSTMKQSGPGSVSHENTQFAFVSLVGLYAAMISDVILIGGQPALFLLAICLGVVARLESDELPATEVDLYWRKSIPRSEMAH